MQSVLAASARALAVPGPGPKLHFDSLWRSCDPGTVFLRLHWSQALYQAYRVWIMGTVPRRDSPVTNSQFEDWNCGKVPHQQSSALQSGLETQTQSNPKWEDMRSCICPRLLSEAFRFISFGSAVRRFVFPCWRLVFLTCVCSCCFGIDVKLWNEWKCATSSLEVVVLCGERHISHYFCSVWFSRMLSVETACNSCFKMCLLLCHFQWMWYIFVSHDNVF